MKTKFSRIRFAGISWSVGLVFSALFFQSAVQAVPPSQQNQVTLLMDESLRYNGSDWLNLPEARFSPKSTKQPNEVVFYAGDDNLRHSANNGFRSVQLRFAESYDGFHPLLQGAWDSAGGSYIGTGLFYNFNLPDTLRLTVGTGPGWYRHHGADPNLGYGLEFASWIELSWVMFDRRVGVSFAHLSNAHLSAQNPGTEGLAIATHLASW